jgi:hypothetical protein
MQRQVNFASILWLAAALLAAACPSTTTSDGRCTPGALRGSPNACGLCGAGTRQQRCTTAHSWEDLGCDDPFDLDGDGYANAACDALSGGCCVDRPDCDDHDPAVHPAPLECRARDEQPCTTPCGTAGTRTCQDSCTWDVCLGGRDGCNGADDDCDTETDEDAACREGQLVDCVTSCGSAGRGPCTADCLAPLGDACEPPAELCNGRDDDCDDDTDEDFPCTRGTFLECTTTCGTPGHGRCDAECAAPAGDDCRPPPEECANGIDDDCDGDTDELEPGGCIPDETVDCTTTCGSTGSGTCTAACLPPDAAHCTPPDEACSGRDDDCDGDTDEGSACVAGATVPCTTICGSDGSGPCTASCETPGPADCLPPVETCGNAADDDCDGDTDEDCSGEDCTTVAPLLPPGPAGPIDLCTSTADGTGSCGGDGGERVFALLVETAGTYTFSTCNVSTSADTVLHLRSTCIDPATELACNDDDPTCTVNPSASSLTLYLEPGRYFVVVDSQSAACGWAQLDWS